MFILSKKITLNNITNKTLTENVSDRDQGHLVTNQLLGLNVRINF